MASATAATTAGAKSAPKLVPQVPSLKIGPTLVPSLTICHHACWLRSRKSKTIPGITTLHQAGFRTFSLDTRLRAFAFWHYDNCEKNVFDNFWLKIETLVSRWRCDLCKTQLSVGFAFLKLPNYTAASFCWRISVIMLEFERRTKIAGPEVWGLVLMVPRAQNWRH